ncbi:hypothetical protein O3G_MSEX001896 [Manduca sexta]|uniref:Uncharacterized protein n=1 Tax=Manduca sexta TaxID=7130 RepID=A0A921YLT0_MANSE|nr:hypothetical protein O3G_MSEX001896 [Manduca sexta]
MNGITKVVLSKGQDTVPSRQLQTTKRKSRLATTLTNASIVPKLTQTDIRRRLLNMKFPVVILGKDQVSSTIQVMDYDPPQFEGLDKHIWPFMIEWSDDYKHRAEIDDRSKCNDIIFNTDVKRDGDTSVQKRRYQHFHGDYKSNKNLNRKVEISTSKQPSNRERKRSNDSQLIPNKNEQISVKQPLDVNSNTQQQKKQKPIHQLKDKMLKLLYKKPPVLVSIGLDPDVTEQCDTNGNNKLNKTDDCVVSNNKTINDLKNYSSTKPMNIKLNEPRSLAFKRPWAKAKWASDFIDNVIKKIKNGVYYSQDLKYDSEKTSVAAKEAFVQTRSNPENVNRKMPYDSEIDESSGHTLTNRKDVLKIIPGFDNSLPELEVQTIDTDKIEIKNCLTNIIVQFDITIPRESDILGINTKKSCSLIPLERNDSNTKLFKCKATILNAMLPAELCSILPDMMRKIVHSDNIKANQPLPINKTDSQLSTISELSHFECFDHFKAIPKQYVLSQEIRQILSGKFSQRSRGTFHKVKRVAFQSLEIVKNLLPEKSSITYVLNYVEKMPKNIRYRRNIQSWLNKQQIVCEPQNKICTKIQPYNHQKHSLIPAKQRFNLWNILENMWASYKMFGPLNTSFSMPICTISLDIPINGTPDAKKVIINFNKLKLDSIFENYAKVKNEHKALCGKDFIPENIPESDASFGDIKSFKKINHIHGNNLKIKKKGFVKLYKKCKSTSNIPNEKNNFSLNKVTCLDDFFQSLGSKSLSCVFDGNSGKKILSSIITMKNWITEINTRQALLVLLLANKKDTPNLIRFRPVLLQGIAVNRITRASELDMEIEVIEREKLNGFSQASDYQRPFDESSEKLLKSLLEKRKQLNPSYLRVMARYVGLGLLKSSTKKINF